MWAVLGLAAGMLFLAFSPAAHAGTASATFQVSANVAETCLIEATEIDFGTYRGTQKTSNGQISITCTNGTTYRVALDAGTSGGTVTTRKMTAPGGLHLSYGLHRDAAHSLNWGDTVDSEVDGTGNGSAQILTVYGLLPAEQFVTASPYTDTITATVNY